MLQGALTALNAPRLRALRLRLWRPAPPAVRLSFPACAGRVVGVYRALEIMGSYKWMGTPTSNHDHDHRHRADSDSISLDKLWTKSRWVLRCSSYPKDADTFAGHLFATRTTWPLTNN